MPSINVRVVNKAPRLVSPAKIVCDNSDYKIVFNFDSEWAELSAKTARFVWNNTYVDVSFTGDTVAVPVLQRTKGVYLGLYAGDMHTTESLFIPCEESILCMGGSEAPSPGPIERGLPSGGNAGQVLSKASEENYDVKWCDPSVPVDNALSMTSENPVQNKVVTDRIKYFESILPALESQLGNINAQFSSLENRVSALERMI